MVLPWLVFVLGLDFILNIIDILNKFPENIKFTYEVEHNNKISL